MNDDSVEEIVFPILRWTDGVVMNLPREKSLVPVLVMPRANLCPDFAACADASELERLFASYNQIGVSWQPAMMTKGESHVETTFEVVVGRNDDKQSAVRCPYISLHGFSLVEDTGEGGMIEGVRWVVDGEEMILIEFTRIEVEGEQGVGANLMWGDTPEQRRERRRKIADHLGLKSYNARELAQGLCEFAFFWVACAMELCHDVLCNVGRDAAQKDFFNLVYATKSQLQQSIYGAKSIVSTSGYTAVNESMPQLLYMKLLSVSDCE